MPTSSLELTAALNFSLSKDVADWESDIEQGPNQLLLSLSDIDLQVWDQVYAGVFELDATDTATIDLRNFTNLAGESGLAMTAALAMAVKVQLSDPEDTTGGELTIGSGASNGFEAWFLPDRVVSAPPAGTPGANAVTPVRVWVESGDVTDEGEPVDATHKTIDLENTGTDAIRVTVIVVGSTAT